MSETDSTQVWYCWSCDRAWDFSERRVKLCPDCNSHGVRSADIG